jgi:hypothetical protein
MYPRPTHLNFNKRLPGWHPFQIAGSKKKYQPLRMEIPNKASIILLTKGLKSIKKLFLPVRGILSLKRLFSLLPQKASDFIHY